MSKTFWYEELAMIVFCQFYSYMIAISRRAFTNIHGYIEDSAFYAADQFALVYGGRWKCRPRITP